MPKWADNIISAVRYNKRRTHITHLMVHVDDGSTVFPPGKVVEVEVVIMLIALGETFITTVRDRNGNYWPGALVEVSLRTHQTPGTADNLESLPEC